MQCSLQPAALIQVKPGRDINTTRGTLGRRLRVTQALYLLVNAWYVKKTPGRTCEVHFPTRVMPCWNVNME